MRKSETMKMLSWIHNSVILCLFMSMAVWLCRFLPRITSSIHNYPERKKTHVLALVLWLWIPYWPIQPLSEVRVPTVCNITAFTDTDNFFYSDKPLPFSVSVETSSLAEIYEHHVFINQNLFLILKFKRPI